MSNFPNGFYGLKARLEILVETLGNDDLAQKTIDDLLDRSLRSEAYISDKRHKHYRSGANQLLGMGDMNFDHIAEMVEHACKPIDEETILGRVSYGDFEVVWDANGIYRTNKNGCIPLAVRNSRTSVEVRPAGMALSVANDEHSKGFRSHWRDFKDREKLLKKFSEWATKEFRLA